MKRLKPTVAMKSSAKQGLELINTGAFPVTARATEIGKKIASGQDLDEDHVSDMAHFHASHNCPGDCEDLLWGGPAGGDWARNKLMQNMRTGFAEENIDFDKIISDKSLNLSLEIYSDIKLDEPTEETDDGLIWAPIARSGMLATRPGPNGEKLDQPLVFVPGHSENPRKEIGLQDVHDAFQDKAHEHVTIPIDMRISGEDVPAHNNKTYQNTGEIIDTKLVDSKNLSGEKVLMGLHKFTEPDIKGKVERGTIPSRSCGLLYDYKNTTTGKVYPISLDHVALTHKPWMGGMAPYGAEEFADDRTIVPMMLSEKSFTAESTEKVLPTKLAQEKDTTSHQKQDKKEIQSAFLADIVWGDKPSFRDVEKQICSILDNMSGGDNDDYPQYHLLDVTDDKALIKVNYGIGPDEDAWVVPYDVDKNLNLHLSPFNEWVDSTKKWVTDVIDPDKDREELDKLGMADHKIDLSVLTSKERKKLPSSAFVYPDEKKYPIHDISHGRNALVRVAQNGNSEEQAKVRAAVYKKYPELEKNKEDSTKMSDPLKVASENRFRLSEQDKHSPLGGQMTLLLSEEQIERLGLEEGPAKEAIVKQNELLKKQSIELAEAKKAEKETSVANDISKFKEEGFDAFPGLLREYEVTALSDDGDIALSLELSEHGHTTKVPETATEIAKRFMKAIPRNKDEKVDLGEFANKLETPSLNRPELKPGEAEEKKIPTTGDELLAQMLADDPTLKKDPQFLALSENGKGI
jgi:hypothetical protein